MIVTYNIQESAQERDEKLIVQLQDIIRQKENDVALAAEIGRTLLDTNNKLVEENQLLSDKVWYLMWT